MYLVISNQSDTKIQILNKNSNNEQRCGYLAVREYLCSCTFENKIQTGCARENSEVTKKENGRDICHQCYTGDNHFPMEWRLSRHPLAWLLCDFAFCTHIPPRVHRIVVVVVLPLFWCSAGDHRITHLMNHTARWWPWLDSNGAALFVHKAVRSGYLL